MNVPLQTSPLNEALDAALYDWHNEQRLDAQLADGRYWGRALRLARSIAVFGAGTGRVVAMLATGAGRRVVAIDRSAGRLARMPAVVGVEAVVADYRDPGDLGAVDAVLLPYSTLQLQVTEPDRVATLAAAASLLSPGGTLAIDVSTSFENRTSRPWERTLAGRCRELDAHVEEWESAAQGDCVLTVRRRFRVGTSEVGEVVEQWAHHRAMDLPRLLAVCGYRAVTIADGYGDLRSRHRRLYRAVRSS